MTSTTPTMSVSSTGGSHTRSRLAAGSVFSALRRHHHQQQQQQQQQHQVNRHRHQRGQHHRTTDYQTEHDTDHNQRDSSPARIGQRSQSLSALQSPAVIQPKRMVQLETLEAKMASIEVSLSSATPRRKKTSLTTTPTPRANSRILNTATTPHRLDQQLEGLKNAARDKENIIRSMRGQSDNNDSYNISGLHGLMANLQGPREKELLNDNERIHLEDRLMKLKSETENKRATIKNFKLALDKLDITDNIDVRIQQAELEYQLGREELNLLTLLEEARTVQARLDESATASALKNRNNRTGTGINNGSTVHACVSEMGGVAILLVIDVRWTPDSPRFGAVVRDNGGEKSVWVEWAAEESGLKKGDRVVEVNGKLLISRNTNREDVLRLLSASPDPAQLVVLRSGTYNNIQLLKSPSNTMNNSNNNNEVAALRSELGLVRDRAEEAQRAKDGLRADNLRLTHRISYLEEQVSELLDSKRQQHHSNNHHQSYTNNNNNSQQQLQQVVKQQQQQQVRIVTTNTSTVLQSHHHRNVTNINISSGTTAADDVQVFQKGSQVTALLASGCPPRPPPPVRTTSSPSSSCIIAASEKYTTTDDEQQERSDSRHSTDIDKIHSSRRRTDVRSVKSLDLDISPYSSSSRSSYHYAKPRKSLDYTSEPIALQPTTRRRPTPPKKPIRLSIHRAQSLQSVENNLVLPTGSMGMASSIDGSGNGCGSSSGGRKRTHREKLSSGLRWPQNGLAAVVHLHQKQSARWC